MKKSKIAILILLIICIVVGIFCFNNNKSVELKENQIKIDNIITTVTSKEEDFDKYKNNHDMSFYDNSNSVDIEIRDFNVLTYENIRIGDSINKLDFCNKSVGMVYYFESKYRSQGYHLEIQYGTDNEKIITITYHFY